MDEHLAFVLHEFAAENDNELSIQPGSILHIINWVNDDWIKGENSLSQTGIFPANHVKVLKQPIIWPTQCVFFISHTAADPAVPRLLPYNDGDVLIGEEIYGDDFYLGHMADRTQCQGLIQLKDVVQFSEADYKRWRPDHRIAIAIQNMTAQLAEELSFQQGERIFMVRDEDNVFFYGRILSSDGSSREGLVPKCAVSWQSDTVNQQLEPPTDCEPLPVLRRPKMSTERQTPPSKLVENRITKVVDNILSFHNSHSVIHQLSNSLGKSVTTAKTNYSTHICDLFRELDHLRDVYEQYTSTAFIIQPPSTAQLLEDIRRVYIPSCTDTHPSPVIEPSRPMSPESLQFLDPLSSPSTEIPKPLPPSENNDQQSPASSNERRLNQKSAAVSELLDTEKIFHDEVKQLLEAFNPSSMKSKAPDKECAEIFVNLAKVRSMSAKLMESLEKAIENEALIANIFTDLKEELFESYCKYMVTYQDANEAMTSEENHVRNFVEEGLCRFRNGEKTGLTIDALLIKPVQRFMKYPLLLQNIAGFMTPSSPEKANMLKAAAVVVEVINRINEKKRSKELSDRYLLGRSSAGSVNLRSPAGTISHARHSLLKKAGRYSQTVVNLAFGERMEDESFDALEERFRKLKVTVKNLHSSISACRDCIECILRWEAQLTNSIVQLLNSPAQEYRPAEAAAAFARVTLLSADEFCTAYHDRLNKEVISPLHVVHHICSDPKRLLNKRKDKLLDKDRLQKELRRVKEAGNIVSKNLEEQVNTAEKVYQAMHNQLLEDLPKFNSIVASIVSESMAIFVVIIKHFITQYLPRLTALQQACASIYDELNYEEMPSIGSFQMRLLDELSGLGLNFESSLSIRSTNAASCDRPSSFSTLQSYGSLTGGSLTKTLSERKSETRDNQLSFRKSAVSPPRSTTFQELFKSTNSGQKVAPQNSSSASKGSPSTSTTWYMNDYNSVISETLSQNKDTKFDATTIAVIENTAVYDNISPPPYSSPPTIHQKYRAAYTFAARKVNELSISAGDELLELCATDEAGNPDWKLMHNLRTNAKGFVPANYVMKL